jgi:eukaryotic-like serine/threonine-protein kinase
MGNPTKLKGRYELKEALGRGGMGVVYRAYDGVLKADVAVKTLREAPDPTELQLFYRECEVLVALNHPNIVQILDMGEYEEAGETKPYFVMPLLPGATLDKLIRNSGTQLTAQRRVDILSQVSRGLHAAHERGLIHRDIKPSNVFVMPDFSAEIIDFGIAHVASFGMTGQKGTLLYMAPELIQGKPPSPASDIFALGVLAFELFTRRRPFERSTEQQIVEAILHESPPPASDIDPNVNAAISRVIHKSMAKQPWHRFSNAREFADCLEKAHRGEPIEIFDTARIRPRIQRARTAFDQGDHQFAMEIIGELEAEGHLDPDLSLLRKQVEIAARQKRIRQLVESARSRMESEEYPLALQKLQEILELEPDNADALSLKAKIESARSEGQIDGWFRLARQHIENNAFAHAREALQNVLQIRPQDSRASGLLSEVKRREQEYIHLRQEKDQLYQAAVEQYQKGEVSAALTKLERVLEMERRAPDSTQNRGTTYQNLYNQVRSEHDAIENAYAAARKHLGDQDYAKALGVCEEYLQKYPGHALFQSLHFDVQEQQRLRLSSYIAEIDRRVEAETDLERKVNIVQESMERFPGELHFERLSRILRERLNLVSAIVAKARYHEERGQFTEALGQWEILRTIHAKYPGLQFEIERVTKRRDQQTRMESKARWVRQIDAHLEAGDFGRALELARSALEEFPDDGELLPLQQLAGQSEERRAEARRLQAEGERLFDAGSFDEGMQTLQQAYEMDKRNDAIRDSLVNRFVARAQRVVETDWRTADILVQRALTLDPAHPGAKNVGLLLADFKREDFLNQAISRIRQNQAAGEFKSALAELEQALSFYPGDPRLTQLRPSLENKLRESGRQSDLEQIQGLAAGVEFVSEAADIQSILELMRVIAGHYPGEREFQAVIETVEQRLKSKAAEPKPPAAPPPPQPAPAPAAPEGGLQPAPGFSPAPTRPAPPAAPPPQPETGAPPKPTQAGPPVPREMRATQILSRAAVKAALEEGAKAAAAAAGGAPGQMGPLTAAPPPVPAAAKPAPAQPSQPAAPAGPGQPGGRRPMILIAAAVGLVAVAVAGWLAFRHRSQAPQTVAFEIRTVPPGATVSLDGKPVGTAGSPIQIAPGDYRFEVAKDGYQAETVLASLKPGAVPAPVQIQLKPRGQTLRLISELKNGKYSLDGGAPADVPADGQLSVEIGAPGRHTFTLEAGGRRASVVFETDPVEPARVEKPEVSGGLAAVVVGARGNRAQVQSSLGAVPVRIGERDAGKLGASGLELNELAPGTLGLALGEGERRWNGSVEIGPAAIVTVFVSAAIRPASILVQVSGADAVDVSLDGAPKGVTANGSLRLNVEPGAHEVRVSKDGFLPTGAQSTAVEKGRQSKVAFVLVPRPAATPVPVKASTLLVGKVQVDVSPASAQVTYAKKGESASHRVAPGAIELEEGDYLFTARSNGFTDSSASVTVKAGAVQNVNLTLGAIPKPRAAPQSVVHNMNEADWDQPWTRDNEWFTRRAGGFVLYKITPTAGTFQFTVRGKGGKDRWALVWANNRNYILFELDKQTYTCTEYRDGKKGPQHAEKKKLGLKDDSHTIRMTVEPNKLAVALVAGGNATVLDEWTRTDVSFTDGKFGFFLNGQMWLANFTFTARAGQ